MSSTISREYRIYLALWRKAMLDKPISIKAPNLHMAIAMRQGMYRAIRPFRDGTIEDLDLQKAAEKYVIYLVKAEHHASPHFLEFRERKALAILEEAWDDLGIDEEDLLFGNERDIGNHLKELIEPQAPRATPFYNRES